MTNHFVLQGNSKPVIKITREGRVELGEGCTNQEAAQVLVDYANKLMAEQRGIASRQPVSAQELDLEKVRSSISAALGLCVICAGEDAYSRGEVRDFGIKMHGELAKTLALLDGRDAGTGDA